jgi:hypothetical protein
MSTNTIRSQNGTDESLPTPDYDVPGLTDLSQLRPGDKIELDDHATPLTVQFVGVKERSTVDGTTTQYALKAEHDRADARTYELYEQINLADGSTIQIVDGRGCPVRVFEVDE